MAIICRLREYTVEDHRGSRSLVRNLVLLAAISVLVASVFLGVFFAAGGPGKAGAGAGGGVRISSTAPEVERVVDPAVRR